MGFEPSMQLQRRPHDPRVQYTNVNVLDPSMELGGRLSNRFKRGQIHYQSIDSPSRLSHILPSFFDGSVHSLLVATSDCDVSTPLDQFFGGFVSNAAVAAYFMVLNGQTQLEGGSTCYENPLSIHSDLSLRVKNRHSRVVIVIKKGHMES